MRIALQRGLSSRHVGLIALGGVIGSSYFLGTGYILGQIGPAAFLAYILGGIISYWVLACLTELAIDAKSQGSFIGYARDFISPTFSIGVGWSYWASWVVYIPSECLATGIILHHFFQSVPEHLFSILCGGVITLINLSKVKLFGEAEFWFSLVKIVLLIGFSVLAFLIFIGAFPTEHFLGTEYLLKNGGFFPNGFILLFFNMVVLLSNFQGSEIIGMTAAELENPRKHIPPILKKVLFRIVGLYLIPTFLLVLIFPWQKADISSGSVFASALEFYGFLTAAHIFNFLIVVGAISCANSGIYATVRCLYALAQQNLAPRKLAATTASGVPLYATLVTLGTMWIILFCTFFFPANKIYTNLLALSGFTGTICWISICWSQLQFRKRAQTRKIIPYGISWFPISTHLAIWIQVLCLLVILISPELRVSFYFGVPVFLLPMLCYKLYTRR